MPHVGENDCLAQIRLSYLNDLSFCGPGNLPDASLIWSIFLTGHHVASFSKSASILPSNRFKSTGFVS